MTKKVDIKCQFGKTCALGDRCLRHLAEPSARQLYFRSNPKITNRKHGKCCKFVDIAIDMGGL